MKKSDNSQRRKRLASKRVTKFVHETLESRIVLDGSGFATNPCAPDLDLSAVETRSVRMGEELSFDLYAAGATAVDLNEDGTPSGDTIRLILDPDDGPSNATLTSDGVFRWTPTADQTGTFEFVVIAIDEGAPPLADAEILTVEVLANTAPDLAAIADVTVRVNELLEMSLQVTDADNEDVTIAFDPDQSIANGPAIEQIDGKNATLRWTPEAQHAGQNFNISVLATDNGIPRLSDNETFVISVSSVIANDDSFQVAAGGVLSASVENGVLANDADSNNAELTVRQLTSPESGTLQLESDGSFVYTPNANFRGADSFSYQLENSAGETSIATATINVLNDGPVAVADDFSTDEDLQLVVTTDNGLLMNDSDPDGDSLTAEVSTEPSNGRVNLNADGGFAYAPDPDFNGVDTFTYTISDGEQSASAEVTIQVNPINDAPVSQTASFAATAGTQLSVDAASGVLQNDSDVDGDALVAIVASPPSNGDLTLNSDGSFTYSSDAGFTGSDSFTYQASDGELISEPTTIEIIVSADTSNATPIGISDSYTATASSTLRVDATSGVLSNDFDPDGDPITAVLVGQPGQGSFTFNPDGSFEYTANANSTGLDGFAYRVTDGTSSSGEILVSFLVSTNLAPITVVDSYTTNQGTGISITAANGVLANDSEPEDETMTAVIVSQPANGTVDLQADGSFTYTPDAAFVGTDLFTYQARDSNDNESSTTAVSITVDGANVASISTDTVDGFSLGNVVTEQAFASPQVYQIDVGEVREELQLNADDHLSGDPTAPVVLVEYLDFQCPVCARFHPVVQGLEQTFDGDLLVVRRHLPLTSIHPNAFVAARAAEAAGQQGMFDEMGDLLFDNQSTWAGLADPESVFEGYASDLNLDLAQYRADYNDPATADRISRDFDEAVALGAQGTPTFFLNGTQFSNPAVSSGQSPDFENLIQAELDSIDDAFAIDRTTGEVKVFDGSQLSESRVTLPVLVKDASGNSETVDFVVNISNAAAGEPDEFTLSVDDSMTDDENWLL